MPPDSLSICTTPNAYEGNIRPGMYQAEITEKGLKNNYVFMEMLEEMRWL